ASRPLQGSHPHRGPHSFPTRRSSDLSGTDSAWQVAGTITVSNPNDWEAITPTAVADKIDNGGACSITSGNPTASIPASGSVKLSSADHTSALQSRTALVYSLPPRKKK